MTVHFRSLRDPESTTDPKEINYLEMHIVGKESIGTFLKLLDRALNCFPDCPAEYKTVADQLKFGTALQIYTDEKKGPPPTL